jgi:ABC-2 type transport system ATP-binding protein
MSDAIINVENLNKSFKKYSREKGLWAAFKSLFHREYEVVNAVNNVSFEVKKGEILGYLGPNGAGQSTVIKMLTGIMHPNSGNAKSLGFTPWLQREKYVQNIGVVFGQKSTLWWDLPAIDTFELNRNIYSVPRERFNKRLNMMVDLLDVKDISKTPVRKLSLGERMRCEFINSMLHDPKIVFLDEPTIGLDVVAKEKIRQFIKKENKERNVTVILTTHDVGDVEELCDRIIIIDKGMHIYEGTVNSLKRKYVTHKELVIEFEDEVKRLSIPNCKVIKQEETKTTINVNIKKTSVSTVIKHLLNKYEIKDIDVNEQSVESIIRKIYEEKRK